MKPLVKKVLGLLTVKLLILFIPVISLAQGSWTQKAFYPTSLGGAGKFAFELGGLAYVGNGSVSSGGSSSDANDCAVYNPASDSWTVLPSNQNSGLCIGYNVSGVGYYTFSSVIPAPLSNQLSKLSSNSFSNVTSTGFNAAVRTYAAGFSIDSILYFGTGHASNGAGLRDIWAYNATTGSWSQIANVPSQLGIEQANGFSLNGKGYIVGGFEGSSLSNYLYQYDPVTNSWTRKANVPTNSVEGATFTLGSKAYLYTGGGGSKFYQYNPATDTWTPKADLPVNRYLSSGFAINNSGYIVGGYASSYSTNYLHQYSPDTFTVAALSSNAFCAGATFNVNYSSASATFTSGNIFTVQLSDSSGSFANPTSIGTLTGTNPSGSISATIPSNTIQGIHYRIRVTASTPINNSDDNGTDIAINQPFTVSYFGPTTGAVGTLVNIVGTSLDNVTSVKIGGVQAIVISTTSTQLSVMVMPGATTGAVSLSNACGTINANGSFIVTATPYPCAQQGNKLKPAGAIQYGNGVEMGWSVALSSNGNTAIAGGPNDSAGAGAVFVYTRSNGVWSQQGHKLIGPNPNGNSISNNLGRSVAISADGNTVIAGMPNYQGSQGGATIFSRTGNTWSIAGLLQGSGGLGQPEQGYSVALSADGNTAVLGAPYDNYGITGSGAIWIFNLTANGWSQAGKFVGTGGRGTWSAQGWSVAVSADGNTVITGAPEDSSTGAAWVFKRTGGVWSQQGSKLTAGGNGSGVGYSVALSADGNIAALGAPGDSSQRGAVYVFTRNGSTWTQQGGRISGSGATVSDNQGTVVSLSTDGNVLVEGAPKDSANNGGAGAVGAMWAFTRSGNVWTQQGPKIVGTGARGYASQASSCAISADGSTMLSGAIGDSSAIGATWVFSSCNLVSTATVTASTTITCTSVVDTFTATATNASGTPSYQWYKNGVMVGTNSTTYISPSISNGDSIWVVVNGNITSNHIVITVLPAATSSITQSVCFGQSYLGYNTTGTYIDTFHNAAHNGCDSIRTLHLTVLQPATSSINQSICQGGSYLGHSTSGTYTDTLHNAASNGCDSIRTLHLTVNNPTTASVNGSFCQGGSYNFYGHTLTSAGTYRDTLRNSNGCDSIVTLTLTLNTYSTGAVSASICAGSSYPFNNQQLTSAGTYYDTLQGSNCDSIVTLTLSIKQPALSTITQSICLGQSFLGHSSAGTFVDTLYNAAANGCDSIRTLNLTILQPATSSIAQSVCAGQSYLGHNSSGTYVDTLHNAAANGCDSIRTLNLTVNPTYRDTVNHSICQGDTYQGHSAAGTYIDTLHSIGGCDSLTTLVLRVDSTIVPQVYLYYGGDSINSNPISICATETGDWFIVAHALNGGSAPSYHWILDTLILPIVSDTIYLHSIQDSFLALSAHTTSPILLKCKMITSLSSCLQDSVTLSLGDTIILCGGIEHLSMDAKVQVFPNPNNGHFTLSISQPTQQLRIELLNIQGQILYTEQLKDQSPLKIELDFADLAKGVYLLKVSTENGVAVKRVVVE